MSQRVGIVVGVTEKTAKKQASTNDAAAGQQRTLMLVDGHSMAFRAFYALKAHNFATTGGQHTNAVYGFLLMLTSLLKQESPSHIAVAFDVSRQTFRSEMFPAYKAQREETPQEFKGQIGLIQTVLQAMGITVIEKDNFEADDIIATLATAAKPLGFNTLIVTGDRDSFQLVNDTTTVLYPSKGVSEMTRFTPDAVAEKYKLTPTQYPDFAALRGDPSDNLPGIPGVGEKTAQKWISKYGSLTNLLDHAEEITGKVGDAFRERLEQVRMNRELTEMIKDVELDLTPEQCTFADADPVELNNQFDALEFGTQLRGRLFAALPNLGEDKPADSAPQIAVVIDATSVTDWLSAHGQEPVAVALAGTPTPGSGDVEALALAAADGHTVVVEMAELSSAEESGLATWLAGDSPKFFHDAKAAWHMVTGRGLSLGGVTHDTSLAAYLLRPGQRTYLLADVYQRHLQRHLPDSETPAGQLTLLDVGEAYRPLATQAFAVMELVTALTEELTAIGQFELYSQLELPLTQVLAEMEHAGIAVDISQLEEQRDAFADYVAEAEEEARRIAAAPELNLSSPKQLQEVLFGTLDMPKTKKTKTGYSTAAKEIEQLAKTHPHPFLDQLLAHREYSKMKTTLQGLIKAVHPDGRIHTTFNQTAASTGRLSSTDPNLQNIPVRTPAGRKIRGAFVVGKGYTQLLTADYSQIEMRVMAHLSGDEGLIQAYQAGEDLHNYVGSQVFDVPVDQVTPELRRRVKAMSYGLVYGLSAFGLAGQLDIPAGEAKKIMEAYFERFGGVKRYLDAVVDKARDDGYTATLFGRRRYLPELLSTNRVARENAERAALNAPIQGTAADIIKVAMLRVHQRLAAEGLSSRVLLQVHDELVVEVASGELERVQRLVEEEMDSAITLDVPLEVSSGHGTTWDEAAH